LLTGALLAATGLLAVFGAGFLPPLSSSPPPSSPAFWRRFSWQALLDLLPCDFHSILHALKSGAALARFCLPGEMVQSDCCRARASGDQAFQRREFEARWIPAFAGMTMGVCGTMGPRLRGDEMN
jgi:hypothetical protein